MIITDQYKGKLSIKFINYNSNIWQVDENRQHIQTSNENEVW